MNRRDKHAITIPFLMHRGDDKASWVEACSFSILSYVSTFGNHAPLRVRLRSYQQAADNRPCFILR